MSTNNANMEPSKELRCKKCKQVFQGNASTGGRGTEAMAHSNYSGHHDFEWVVQGAD